MSAETTHHDESNYLNASSGFMSWFWTIDHKRLGIMYLATILTFFLIGGSFAMLVRYELLDAAPTLSAQNLKLEKVLSRGLFFVLRLLPHSSSHLSS